MTDRTARLRLPELADLRSAHPLAPENDRPQILGMIEDH
jgi:hypothetical protein